MTRVLYLNDTSRWHVGSAVASESIAWAIVKAGGEIVRTVITGDARACDDALRAGDYDALVINGEGTLHDCEDCDSREWPAVLMRACETAMQAGKRVAVVNALWCRMSPVFADILRDCDLVVFRDTISRAVAGMPDAPCFPDAALMCPIPTIATGDKRGHLTGTSPMEWNLSSDPDARVPRSGGATAWVKYLCRLAEIESLRTCQHHALLAAAIVGTSVVPWSSELLGRGWKNEGLMAWAGLPAADSPDAEPVETADLARVLVDEREKMVEAYPMMLRDVFEGRTRETADAAGDGGEEVIIDNVTIFKAHVRPERTSLIGGTWPAIDFGPDWCSTTVANLLANIDGGYYPTVHMGHHESGKLPEHVGFVTGARYDADSETIVVRMALHIAEGTDFDALRPSVEVAAERPEILSVALIHGPLDAGIDKHVPMLGSYL
jgi:hypothetical protein